MAERATENSASLHAAGLEPEARHRSCAHLIGDAFVQGGLTCRGQEMCSKERSASRWRSPSRRGRCRRDRLGRAERHHDRARRRRLCAPGLLRRPHRHAQHRRAGPARAALLELALHGDVHADALMPADPAQRTPRIRRRASGSSATRAASTPAGTPIARPRTSASSSSASSRRRLSMVFRKRRWRARASPPRSRHRSRLAHEEL
jgi:hypothetical protein